MLIDGDENWQPSPPKRCIGTLSWVCYVRNLHIIRCLQNFEGLFSTRGSRCAWYRVCVLHLTISRRMNTKMRNKQKGFSLIELLIVVAIILIIAAIAIPNLIRSKMAANEASAVATLRTINTSQVVYASTYSTTPVFGTLAYLGSGGSNGASCTPAALQVTPPTALNACLIDN